MIRIKYQTADNYQPFFINLHEKKVERLKLKNIGFVLTKNDADAVIVSSYANIRYLSGFSGEGYAVFTHDGKYIFTDFRYVEQARKQSPGFEVFSIDNGGYPKLFSVFFSENKITKVCFEDCCCLYSDYKLFKDSGADVLVPLGSELDSMRRIKTDEEIEHIKKAEHIGDLAFSEIIGYIDTGMTEIEVAAKLEYFMKTNGGEKIAFDTIVASGKNSSMPHAVTSSKKIEDGDFVTFDFGCMFNGYCSDMTRTVVMGKASDRQTEIYDIVFHAQKRALDQAEYGMTGCEIDALARDYITSFGYGEYFGHATGHGIGLNVHELPVISVKGKETIKENMVFSIEPGIYIPEFGGVRIEDLVYMSRDGLVNITGSEKNIIQL